MDSRGRVPSRKLRKLHVDFRFENIEITRVGIVSTHRRIRRNRFNPPTRKQTPNSNNATPSRSSTRVLNVNRTDRTAKLKLIRTAGIAVGKLK